MKRFVVVSLLMSMNAIQAMDDDYICISRVMPNYTFRCNTLNEKIVNLIKEKIVNVANNDELFAYACQDELRLLKELALFENVLKYDSSYRFIPYKKGYLVLYNRMNELAKKLNVTLLDPAPLDTTELYDLNSNRQVTDANIMPINVMPEFTLSVNNKTHPKNETCFFRLAWFGGSLGLMGLFMLCSYGVLEHLKKNTKQSNTVIIEKENDLLQQESENVHRNNEQNNEIIA